MNIRMVTSLIAAVLFYTPAYSHHSPESHYLVDELITVTGVVTKFLPDQSPCPYLFRCHDR